MRQGVERPTYPRASQKELISYPASSDRSCWASLNREVDQQIQIQQYWLQIQKAFSVN
jgi:hypothetical protein